LSQVENWKALTTEEPESLSQIGFDEEGSTRLHVKDDPLKLFAVLGLGSGNNCQSTSCFHLLSTFKRLSGEAGNYKRYPWEL
jgi:hypothetical protein